jgi:hypothetical protein
MGLPTACRPPVPGRPERRGLDLTAPRRDLEQLLRRADAAKELFEFGTEAEVRSSQARRRQCIWIPIRSKHTGTDGDGVGSGSD